MIKEFLKHNNFIEGEYSDQAYRDALNAWSIAMKYDKLSMEMILDIHGALMETLNPRIAGKFRRCNVRVGYNVCPNYKQVEELINRWVDYNKCLQKEEDIKIAHISFESIHPFEDGNGRTGRILFNWHRLYAGLPILVIHEGDEQFEYYKWFN